MPCPKKSEVIEVIDVIDVLVPLVHRGAPPTIARLGKVIGNDGTHGTALAPFYVFPEGCPVNPVTSCFRHLPKLWSIPTISHS